MELRPSQVRCREFIGQERNVFLQAPVGSGKTAIGLWAMADALERGEVSRWLVVAPPRVARFVWPREPEEPWMRGFPKDQLAVATGTPKQRAAMIEDPANRFVVISYNALPWFVRTYCQTERNPFDGILFDEVDKIKNPKAKWFKLLKYRLGAFNQRVAMTATPAPNDWQDLWTQVYVVDRGETFGRSFYGWRQEYFRPTDYRQFNWAPMPNTEQRLLDAIASFSARIAPGEVESPDVVHGSPRWFEVSADVREQYEELARELVLEILDADGELAVEIEAATKAVLQGKLQQLSSGFLYDADRNATWLHSEKFDQLEELAKELRGQQLMVVHHFREELAEVRRRFPKCGTIGGPDSSDATDQYTIDAWNDGALRMVSIHPMSAGHGLNLQHSFAANIAFLTSPWSYGQFEQVVGRVARSGNEAPAVFVHTFPMLGNVADLAVQAALREKGDILRAVVEGLREL